MARDPVTGRFVKTSNTPEAGEGKFETYTELPVEIVGADPANLAYGTDRRYAPMADELAQGGQGPLRARHAELVHSDDAEHETWGRQGAVLRSAARGVHDDTASTVRFLVGLESHGYPATGVHEIEE